MTVVPTPYILCYQDSRRPLRAAAVRGARVPESPSLEPPGPLRLLGPLEPLEPIQHARSRAYCFARTNLIIHKMISIDVNLGQSHNEVLKKLLWRASRPARRHSDILVKRMLWVTIKTLKLISHNNENTHKLRLKLCNAFTALLKYITRFQTTRLNNYRH